MEINVKIDIDDRVIRLLRKIVRSKKLGIICMIAAAAVPLSIYAVQLSKPHTFQGGDIVSASKINENFDALYDRINSLAAERAPIGSILAFHKSLSGVPNLPEGWVECNGQTIADGDSPLNGQTLPDLNTSGRFLRGASNSGIMQDDSFQGHHHRIGRIGTGGSTPIEFFAPTATNTPVPAPSPNFVPGDYNDALPPTDASFSVRAMRIETDAANGTPRISTETRPSNMSVIWIIRIK